MGMDQKVMFSREKAPAWQALVELLAGKNLALQMRMIDGGLAFPDETPPEDWRELRVIGTGDMITLRREDDGVTLIIWGNADADTRRTWNALAWAFATLTGGTIRTAAGQQMTLAEFVQTAELPADVSKP